MQHRLAAVHELDEAADAAGVADPELAQLEDQITREANTLGSKSVDARTSNAAVELKVLIDRAHRRGLEVIGHGVEDAQAAATLWMSGIDFIQGNLVQQADRDMDFDFQQAVL